MATDPGLAVDACRSRRSRDHRFRGDDMAADHRHHAKPGTDRANSRLDAVRTGLAAGAGAGAAVGLMLAFRRQHHQEIATVLTDRDATERRITELYTKAVEQLGNDKAPVRLGGLYALERLAQDNPAHRQTIVNVICAYLRMPFSPTAPTSKPEPEATEEDLGEPAAENETRTVALGDTWQQERQVRLTAQRILAEHLRDDRAKDQQSTDPPSARFWPSIRLDLAGATLIDFNLDDGVMADASSTGRPSPATPGSAGRPSPATPCSAGRPSAGDAFFAGATFTGGALFDGAPSAATPSSARRPSPATPVRRGDLHRRRLVRRGDLRPAWFGRATFSGRAFFGGATFTGDAGFGEATFSGDARFDGATFTGGADGVSFERSHVLSPGAQHVWPTGWRLGPDGSGGHTVVRANDDGRS